jgi:chaperonin GroES
MQCGSGEFAGHGYGANCCCRLVGREASTALLLDYSAGRRIRYPLKECRSLRVGKYVMAEKPGGVARSKRLEFVEPIGMRVLVRKDEPKRKTRGGIELPDSAEIPTITGRIVTISAAIRRDEDLPLRQYDKVLFHPKNAIPVDFESDNQLFVVPVEDIVAVFRTKAPNTE